MLSPNECHRLGVALDSLEQRGDALDTHRQCLMLTDMKSGPQLQPIGASAIAARRAAPGGEGSPHAYSAARGAGHIVGLKVLRDAVQMAGLYDVTADTFRYAFASVALELGYSELTIAGLLGHHTHSVTARYAHHVAQRRIEYRP